MSGLEKQLDPFTMPNVKLFTLQWRGSVGYSCCQVLVSLPLCDGRAGNHKKLLVTI